MKDDVEEFMTTIKNLASTLAFNEEAQVMAIKSNMPRDIYGLCMQYDKLDELKKFLIELFENPRMKAKTEPATTRIMRLLDRLSAYSFNLYYVKGRDMILADYLSRHRNKDLDSSELIPISFCCMNVFRSLLKTEHGLEVYNINTRSSTKASGEMPPEVHGADKPLDPNLKPEHQSKSKLPSIVGAKSPVKSPTKTQTPKRSPRKSVTISEDPPEEIPITSYETDPLQDLGDTL